MFNDWCHAFIPNCFSCSLIHLSSIILVNSLISFKSISSSNPSNLSQASFYCLYVLPILVTNGFSPLGYLEKHSLFHILSHFAADLCVPWFLLEHLWTWMPSSCLEPEDALRVKKREREFFFLFSNVRQTMFTCTVLGVLKQENMKKI